MNQSSYQDSSLFNLSRYSAGRAHEHLINKILELETKLYQANM